MWDEWPYPKGGVSVSIAKVIHPRYAFLATSHPALTGARAQFLPGSQFLLILASNIKSFLNKKNADSNLEM